jgi:hypothetical protein
MLIRDTEALGLGAGALSLQGPLYEATGKPTGVAPEACFPGTDAALMGEPASACQCEWPSQPELTSSTTYVRIATRSGQCLESHNIQRLPRKLQSHDAQYAIDQLEITDAGTNSY